MLEYTTDVLLIGLASVLFVEAVKAPIKVLLNKKGLKDDEQKAAIFNMVAKVSTFIVCFIGSLIYFFFIAHVNPFLDLPKLGMYLLGTLGASQAEYFVLECAGREGLLALLKIKLKEVKVTKIEDINVASVVAKGIQERYDGAPVTEEDIQNILDHNK